MEIRKNWKGSELTSPRRLSDKIFTKPLLTKLNEDYIPNMGFNMFGQFLTHDVAGQTNIHHNICKYYICTYIINFSISF